MKRYIEQDAVEKMLEDAQLISDGEFCGYCTEEEAEMCRAAIKLHEEQIGDCSTCVNLDRSTEPGFVTDYGGCRMGKAFFAEKACGLVDHVCDGYTEERGLVEWARARLAELA